MAMTATDGHVLDLRARPDVDADELEDVRRHLVDFLGEWLVASAVLDDQVLRLHVATASRITALAAIRAGVGALGCEDLFLVEAHGLHASRSRL
jgi:hypothetical protein